MLGVALAVGCARHGSSHPAPPSRPPPSPDWPKRHEDLEKRVAALEAQVRLLQARPQAPSGPDPSAEGPADDFVLRTRTRFEHESRDPTWAPVAERDFESHLKRIGARAGFVLKQISCRTTLCIAELEWVDSRSAARNAGDVVHGEYRQNCARGGLTPSSDAKPFRDTVFFDCQENRKR